MSDIHLSILNGKFFSFFLPSLILTSFYLLIVGVQGHARKHARTHARTRAHMVRLLWTRDCPITETYT